MSAIASIQYGTVSVTLNSTSNTATITSVDTTRSNVIYLGTSTTETNAPRFNVDIPRLTLTNATTVTATRNVSGSTPITVAFVVIQWSAGTTTNVQQGNIVIANSTASNTATITSVDTTKSVLFWTGQETAEATFGRSAEARLALTNTTTVTATRDSSADASTITVGYVVVSFA